MKKYKKIEDKLFQECSVHYRKQEWKQILDKVIRAGGLIRGRLDESRTLILAGAAARSIGQLRDAEQLWLNALELDPKNADALNNLGVINRESGRLLEAKKYFEIAIEVKPSATNYNNLGVVFYNLRQFSNAVIAYRNAIKIDNKHADAWANLGNSLKDLHQPLEAEKAYLRALEIKPDYPWALACMAHVKQKLTQQEEAIAYSSRALELAPDDAEIRLTALNTALPLRPHTESDASRYLDLFDQRLLELEDWVNKDPKNLISLGSRVGYSQPYFVAYREGNHRERLSRYGTLMSRAVNAQRPNVKYSLVPWDGKRQLKIGIVSGFIFRHSVWDIILKGLVLNIDRKIFNISIYHTGSTVDDQTEIARNHADRFVQGPNTHDIWIEMLQQDELDVILYPEIGMDPYSMHLSCLRLAKLQIVSWGHPMTSGIPTLDWYLSGDVLESAVAQEHYSELLIKLPSTGVCTYPVEIKPRRLSIEVEDKKAFNGKVKFYLCQHAFKFTDRAINLIVKIAERCNEALFILVRDSKYPDAFNIAIEQIHTSFEAAGLAYQNRVYILPWMNRAQFLGSFKHIDIYLDLPGFSGYTTAWQAISQGVPVLTLEGDFLRQRLAAGLLRQVHLSEGIVETDDGYVDKACEWAVSCMKNPEGWAEYRNSIERLFERSNNVTLAVREFENHVMNYFSQCNAEGVFQDMYQENVKKTVINNDGSQATNTAPSHTKTEVAQSIPLYLAQMSDINYLKNNPHDYLNREVICTDPYIMEMANQAGIKKCQLRRLNVSPYFQQQIVTEAYSRAVAIDQRLSRIRRKIFGDIPHPGWDAQLHGMFLMRALTQRDLAPYIDLMLSNYQNAEILSPDFAQHLYFDSFVTGSILLSNSKKLVNLKQYSDGPTWRNDFNDWMFNFTSLQKINDAEVNKAAIVHIATCFHHKAYFEENLKRKYDVIIDFPSLLWDVPVARRNEDRLVPLDSQLGDKFNNMSTDYKFAVEDIWNKELDDLLPTASDRSRQTAYFMNRARLQSATYLCADATFRSNIELVLSDHDLGVHGPLFSAARKKGVRIIVLPHSIITPPLSFIPHGQSVTLFQGVPRKKDIYSVQGDILDVHLDPCLKISQRIQRFWKRSTSEFSICILLNTMYSTGMSYVDIFDLREMYHAVKNICAERKWKLTIRPKPSGVAPFVLAQTLGIPTQNLIENTKGDLSSIASNTDLCIVFGEYTTAANCFLDAGSHVVYYSRQAYPEHYWSPAEGYNRSFISIHELIKFLSRLQSDS